jgi:hypothetical protein
MSCDSKLAVALAHPDILGPHPPLSHHLLPFTCSKKKIKGETKRKRNWKQE